MSSRTRALIVGCLLLIPTLYLTLSQMFRPYRAPAAAGVSTKSEEDAITALERRAGADPSPANRIDLSQAYIHAGRYGQAVEMLTTLLSQDPQNVIAWNNLCVARTLQKEFNLAIDACNKGVQADGSYQLIRNNLKWAQEERGKVVFALAAQERTDPSKRDGNFYLEEGLNYLHLGAYAEAEKAWNSTLKLDPASSLAWNNLGTAEMMQHHSSAALQDFQKAKTLDPESALITNNIAWAEATIRAEHP